MPARPALEGESEAIGLAMPYRKAADRTQPISGQNVQKGTAVKRQLGHGLFPCAGPAQQRPDAMAMYCLPLTA
jgi:hypothetical protein